MIKIHNTSKDKNIKHQQGWLGQLVKRFISHGVMKPEIESIKHLRKINIDTATRCQSMRLASTSYIQFVHKELVLTSCMTRCWD